MNYMWALYAREVKRFQKIWMDTVFSPLVTIGLYLGIFGIIASNRTAEGLPYVTFVYTGLLAMMIVNSSFNNPAFALVIAKNLGTIMDLQVVPLAPWRIGIAYSLAAFTRGIITLIIAVLLTAWFIPSLGLAHPFLFPFVLLLTGLEFGMLGVLFGFLAKSFDALNFMTIFVMQPMIFLAGVFYPVATLPYPWSTFSYLNPIHHNVNMIRFAITGYSDINPLVSAGVALFISIALFILMQRASTKSLRAEQK